LRVTRVREQTGLGAGPGFALLCKPSNDRIWPLTAGGEKLLRLDRVTAELLAHRRQQLVGKRFGIA
jgi:hypothetical protein